jgi:iron complex transport system substrate-binding protein
VDRPGRARRLAQACEAAIEDVRTRTEGLDPVRVYWEWWPNPPYTPGAEGWTSEAIRVAGGENVFDGHAEQSVEVNLEDVRAADPDAIVLCWQGTLAPVQSVDKLVDRDGWDGLRAVQNGRVIERPEALHGRPGPRIVEGIVELAHELPPELGEKPEPYAWAPDGIKDRLPLTDTNS